MLLGAVNSMAIKDDLLAIAIEGEVKKYMERFYSLNERAEGTLIKVVEAGALTVILQIQKNLLSFLPT